jgi:zinc protease
VSVQAWARAGSIHEGTWLGAGLSHVLEHMLFKGTTHPGGPDRPGSAGRRRLHERLHELRPHGVLGSTCPTPARPPRSTFSATSSRTRRCPPTSSVKELDVIRREMDMGEDDPGRRSSKGLVRAGLHQESLPLPDHRPCWTLFNRITRDDLLRLLPSPLRAEQLLPGGGGRCAGRRGDRAGAQRPTREPRRARSR